MDEPEAVIIGLLVFIVVMAVVICTAVFTHESHIRDLRYNKDEMVACIQAGHQPQECRDMVYGRGQ